MSKIEKTGFLFTIFILVALLFLVVFSKNGILDYNALKDKETAIINQTAKVNKENKIIENEIKSLKTDLEYIKHIAKQEHDMAADDELIFKDKPEMKGNEE